MRRVAGLLLCLLALTLGGCLSDEVGETAATVLTLQSGTISELRTRRGQGPFEVYERSPDVMLKVIERAARKARGAGGHPVQAIFVSALRGEVLAKERAPEHAADDAYAPPFRSAMLAVVHPVRDRPGTSRVEIHTIQRGPLHQGQVAWERDMPRWIETVLAEIDAGPPSGVRPIP